MPSQNDEQQSRALVPASPRAIEPKRWLPSPATQKLALGVTISAVGSLFIKRLVELAAEDLYQVGRSTLEKAITRQQDQAPTTESPTTELSQNPILNVPGDAPRGRYRVRARFAGYYRVRQCRANVIPEDKD